MPIPSRSSGSPSDQSEPGVSRRTFLYRAARLGLVSTSAAALLAACDTTGASHNPRSGTRRGERPYRVGYGPLVVEDGPARVPRGFRVKTFGAIGDEMSDGGVTPVALDGMAAFAAGGGRIRLLRNHEDRNGPHDPIGANPYDSACGGGVVTLELTPDLELARDLVSLSGTAVNCAGGPTPWGSWLSCEEITWGPSRDFEKPHGYVFEVPASADAPVDPVPLKALGRFRHEAVGLDPDTGILYLTEDNSAGPYSGFYRFLPKRPLGGEGSLRAGGRLQLMQVVGEPELELFQGWEVGQTFDVAWVDIDEPDPEAAETRPAAVFMQGFEKGAAAFDRLEGCWFGERAVYFHDTHGGAARKGQVWKYTPAEETLTLIFESPGSEVLDSPDHITVAPWGGVVMCEDGHGTNFLRGLTASGEVFDIAENILNGYEWAGACFSPDGTTLFANIQGPTRGRPEERAGEGMTLAIQGPW